MDYLKGNVTASAGALYVICRHLSRVGGSCTSGELREALRPLREHRNDKNPQGTDTLATSLKVGEGIGLVTDSRSEGWVVDPEVGESLADPKIDGSEWFRGELLRRVNAEAMTALKKKDKPADLVLAMAWFLQQNPMKPLGTAFNAGAEDGIAHLAQKDGTLVKAVENQEQWRGFVRWSLALGLARNVDVPGTKVIVADASTAIADQFSVLPRTGRAEDWLGVLVGHLPIFGLGALLSALPPPRAGWATIPPAVSLGLLKLERAGALKLESADDGRGVVAIGIGGNTRQVGVITVTGVTA